MSLRLGCGWVAGWGFRVGAWDFALVWVREWQWPGDRGSWSERVEIVSKFRYHLDTVSTRFPVVELDQDRFPNMSVPKRYHVQS